MKKYVILALLFVPMVAYSAPSVRVLGNKTDSNTVATTKAAPAKLSATANNNTSGSRIGTMRAKPATSKTGAGTDSRFPVALTNPKYQAIEKPKTGVVSVVTTADVDTDEIVNEVMNKVGDNYYNKTYIDNNYYNNAQFDDAVRDVDDPRVDAIRIGRPDDHEEDLPSNYVYMWIEP